MLTITPINCDLLNVTTPGSDILLWLQGVGKSFRDVCSYTVKLEHNCCAVEYVYYPNYIFTASTFDNTQGTFLLFPGINPALVDTMEVLVSTDDTSYTPVGSLTNNPSTLTYDTEGDYTILATYYWKVTITNTCGLTYVLEFQTNNSNGGFLINLVVTYPTNNTIITFDNNADTIMELTYEAFEQTGETLEDGVYQVSVIENATECSVSEVEVDNHFLDCDVRCKLAKLIAKCDNCEAIFRYQALIYNNICEVLTYQEMCDIYKLLYSAITDDCITKKPCNCKDK